VAHYVELRGALDPALLGKAIVAGLQMRIRRRTQVNDGRFGKGALRRYPLPDFPLLFLNLAQDLRVDGGNPLVCHQLLRVGDDRWYWYQRYHHLVLVHHFGEGGERRLRSGFPALPGAVDGGDLPG
jgi:enterobactin synthetase component F